MTAALRSCTRFTRAGDPCENLTDFADRWCRECDGYRRSSREGAPESEPVYVHTKARDLDTAPQRRPEGLDTATDVSTVRITQKAVDSFRFQHGGSDEEARIELAIMLEDFSLQSIGKATGVGFLALSREGFSIVLSPGRDSLVSYRTVHRERTWSQVKAGVKSRFRGSPTSEIGPTYEPGPRLEFDDPAQVLDHLRASPPRMTKAAFTGAARTLGTPRVFDADETAALRAEFDADLERGGAVTTLDNGAFSFRGREVGWLISNDGQAVIGAKSLGAIDAQAEQGAPEPAPQSA